MIHLIVYNGFYLFTLMHDIFIRWALGMFKQDDHKM